MVMVMLMLMMMMTMMMTMIFVLLTYDSRVVNELTSAIAHDQRLKRFFFESSQMLSFMSHQLLNFGLAVDGKLSNNDLK